MSRRDLIDPEVREPLDQLLQAIPGGFNSIPDIVQRRAIVTQLLAALEIPPNLNVTSADRTVPGPEGAPDIKVRIYRPAEATGTLPGIYYIHGGGMILGDIDGEDAVATEICERSTRWSSPSSTAWLRNTPIRRRSRTATPAWCGWRATPANSASTRIASPCTAAAPEAASPSPPRCSPATAASRRSGSRCRSTR